MSRADEAGRPATGPEGKARPSLERTAARGGVTLGVAGVLEQVVQFARAIILARLLSPEEFGLMGMALIVIRAGESLSQTGFGRALVQKRGEAHLYMDTVWVVSVVRGLALFAVAWVVSPLAASFFSTPEVQPVLRYVAIGLVLQGFRNPGLFMLEREFRFVKQSLPTVVAATIELGVSVVLAFLLRNIWAMVYGFVIGQLVFTILSYIVRPYRPRLKANWEQIREFHRFGKHIFRARAVDYFVSQLDRLLIGRMLGAGSLGLYTVAWRIASVPATGLYNVVFRVVFPVFSSIQDDAIRLRDGFLRALAMMSTLAFPIAMGFWLVARDFVAVVLGEHWMEMVPAFRALCLAGAVMAIIQLTTAVISAIGRPSVSARVSYIILVGMAVLIYPAVSARGIEGAALALGISSVMGIAYLFPVSMRVMGARARSGLRAIAAPLLGAVGMAVIVIAFRNWFGGEPGMAVLAGEIAVGVLSYVALTSLADWLMDTGLIPSLSSAVRSAGRRMAAD